ncbi:hypothetical protein KBD33_03745 [Candidatus Gracilibacteria bacterium]|nr:hypothetical protein [Candidatus Gracilibacteria bacterium]
MTLKINHNPDIDKYTVSNNGISGKLGTFVAASVFSLSACINDASIANYPVLPEGLKDCHFYKLSSKSEPNIMVVRCPNSTTSVTTDEKNPKTIITIDRDAKERIPKK